MRVKKVIKGEVYYFYAQFIINKEKVKVRYFQSDEWIICDLSKDFNYILLPENKFIKNGVSIKN